MSPCFTDNPFLKTWYGLALLSGKQSTASIIASAMVHLGALPAIVSIDDENPISDVAG